MGLFFYATDIKGTGKPLWDLYQDLSSEYQREFFQSIDTFSQKLRQPQGYQSVAILLASTQEELTDIEKARLKRVHKEGIFHLAIPDDFAIPWVSFVFW